MDTKSFLPSIFRASDHDMFRALQKQIDRVFSDFSRDLYATGWSSDGSFGLPLDVTESDNALEITADLPGVEEKDIRITLSGDLLTIKAEKKSEKEEKGKNYRLSERSFGGFERRMALPFKADGSKVEAKFDKGVLKVTVPKTAEAKVATQIIPVKAAA